MFSYCYSSSIATVLQAELVVHLAFAFPFSFTDEVSVVLAFLVGRCLGVCQNSCPGKRGIRPSSLQNCKAEGCLYSRDITTNPSQAFEKLELEQWSAPKKTIID